MNEQTRKTTEENISLKTVGENSIENYDKKISFRKKTEEENEKQMKEQKRTESLKETPSKLEKKKIYKNLFYWFRSVQQRKEK